MGDKQPFLPSGTVLVDIERVDADLGLVEGSRFHIVGRGMGEVA